jgi:hypothetical protein
MKIERRFPLFALITTTNTQQQTTHNVHEIVGLSSWFIYQRPFFSVSFQSSIAVGSYFIFNVGSCGKPHVGHIIEATKADKEDDEDNAGFHLLEGHPIS